MSKERFEYKKHEFIDYISDNKTGIMYNVTNHNNMTDITKLLNKQSQRIAELEQLKDLQENEKVFSRKFAIEQLEKVKNDILEINAYFKGLEEWHYDMRNGFELGFLDSKSLAFEIIDFQIQDLQEKELKELQGENK